MKPLSDDDPLARRLADLPAVPLDPALAESVRREARDALVAPLEAPSARPFAPALLLRLWSTAVLPAVLLASGAVYTWSAVRMLGRIYLSG